MSLVPTLSALSSLPAEAGVGGNPVADFSDTPLWLAAVKAVAIFVYLMLQVVLVIWFERRVIGRMQQRPGPNRFGPWGIGQTLADGFKLMWKETFVPKGADTFTFLLAPIIAGAVAFVGFAIIPVGGTVNLFGHMTPLQITDAPVAVLVVLAAAGVGAYGFVLAGWSSGSTYPLLGGLRSTAQVVSYEIAMGLSLVAVFLYAGSMSTSSIVAAQRDLWFVIPAFFSFAVYVICMVGETNRLPFDLAEGEGELVGGYHTEYSGMRFAMFFLGEYVNMFTVSALATTMFLGGPAAPPGIAAIGGGVLDQGWWGLLWFTIKMWVFMWFFVWLRGSLPRTRYDQFMRFGWKFLIPATLVWVLAVAFIRGAQLSYLGENTLLATVIVVLVVAVGALVAAWNWDERRARATESEPVPDEIDPFAGGFPVPPLPGQQLREPDGGVTAGGSGSGALASSASSTPTSIPALGTTKEAHRGGSDA
ncbi:NADH-quinone oxidoreductase subunit NuoH [Agilicoccus flavus]|uniref:NADH-quinone oxidoreductase subunit NuoH n=1 Tax=Agilicoccus flavus TaxID=2775968 RepID=UPI001CF61252|nr:NADH-quinone oxidoreductase subunit NuoH [Agilicoccus flavus]